MCRNIPRDMFACSVADIPHKPFAIPVYTECLNWKCHALVDVARPFPARPTAALRPLGTFASLIRDTEWCILCSLASPKTHSTHICLYIHTHICKSGSILHRHSMIHIFSATWYSYIDRRCIQKDSIATYIYKLTCIPTSAQYVTTSITGLELEAQLTINRRTIRSQPKQYNIVGARVIYMLHMYKYPAHLHV